MNKLQLALIVVSTAAITACGGSDDEVLGTPPVVVVPPVTAEVPASASATEAGLFAYLDALFKANADGLEPVDLSNFSPSLSDTTEPMAIG
ncbi:MAG: hypothetical protein IV092_17635 [Burkholderiaceae bacterium]|nr:hypothetical protein [Burkholderiaceae bacterium]MBT9503072.1 hypothetical protein [Burkholderiaceae bacterium]